jgi:hypothetical protein
LHKNQETRLKKHLKFNFTICKDKNVWLNIC